MFISYVLVAFLLSNISRTDSAKYKFSSENELTGFLLTEYEREQTRECHRLNIATYNYNVNLTNQNNDILINVTLEGAAMDVYYYKKYFQDLNASAFSTDWLRRQMKTLTKIGDAALPKKDHEKLTRVINSMSSTYGKARICPFGKPTCSLKTEGLTQEPDVDDILASSRNVAELAYVWQSWRDATGRKVKKAFEEYVRLKNKAAVLDGFVDVGAAWRSDYEMPNMESRVHEFWLQLEPLYIELHTYVLNKLANFYGPRINVSDGLMPAHITGNNYGQNWEYIKGIVLPFRDSCSVDVTGALKANNYTVRDMFETANEFYTSMGLADMRSAFGPKAMITRPDNGEVVCHASAWDMCDGKDFRISMCAEINRETFGVIHHELGHIQYYMQYRNQPYVFRSSANPAFHEAIGDAIVLSVVNENHLKKIGLLSKKHIPCYESTINSLMERALEDIPNFAFTYLVDRWRWDVFKGKYRPEQWNNLWWQYRRTVQKVKPPIARRPSDFDPGSKFHVVADVEYMIYFLAQIIKFQLYRGLCIAAGEFDPRKPNRKPLHECDFYRSKVAGERLKAGLEVGKSVHWSVALKMMTGQSDLDPSAIFDYFEPLIEFLQSQKSFEKR